MAKRITGVEVERKPISDRGDTALFATVTRFGQTVSRYRVSDASAWRLSRAIHGKYSCRWPLCGRRGWYAVLGEYKKEF